MWMIFRGQARFLSFSFFPFFLSMFFFPLFHLTNSDASLFLSFAPHFFTPCCFPPSQTRLGASPAPIPLLGFSKPPLKLPPCLPPVSPADLTVRVFLLSRYTAPVSDVSTGPFSRSALGWFRPLFPVEPPLKRCVNCFFRTPYGVPLVNSSSISRFQFCRTVCFA